LILAQISTQSYLYQTRALFSGFGYGGGRQLGLQLRSASGGEVITSSAVGGAGSSTNAATSKAWIHQIIQIAWFGNIQD